MYKYIWADQGLVTKLILNCISRTINHATSAVLNQKAQLMETLEPKNW